MMINEFTERTGVYPTADLYRAIEDAYYDFDGNKDAFCKAYKENKDGLAERIATAAQEITEGRMRAKDATVKAAEASKTALEDRIKLLEAQLERELEWKPWIDENAFSQERYDALKRSGHEMSDDESKRWIADEFGFDYDKIRICRRMNTFEVNRHHQLRKSGEIDRAPYYDATDWYYVFFSVCGVTYEAHDGTFTKV